MQYHGKKMMMAFKTKTTVTRTMRISPVCVEYRDTMRMTNHVVFLAFALSSSIHTIHRPVARIRRRSTAVATASSEGSSIEEEEEGDFDPQVSTIAPGSEGPASTGTGTPPDRTPATNGMMRRSTSLATIKVQKRARLAEKLKEVFEVNEVEEVIAGTSSLKLVGCVLIDAPIHLEMPCWLLRSVCMCSRLIHDDIQGMLIILVIVLQGYMYLTNSHICFFAHMPSREVGEHDVGTK